MKIVARSRKPPHPFLIRLDDGRLIKDMLEWTRVPVQIGHRYQLTKLPSGQPKLRPYAIDVEVL